MAGHTALGDYLPKNGKEGSPFPGLIQPNDIVNSASVVAILPGDSGVVIGFQLDAFTHTWLAEHFMLDHTLTLSSRARCQH